MDVVKLKNGTEIAIRPIRPDDGAALREAYDRLSDETKYKRFLAAKPHLTGGEIRYLTHLDARHHVALVATPSDRPTEIIGVARFVIVPDDPQMAEFAITIGDPYQHQGVGTALMERLAHAATGLGVRRFLGTMLADNLAAHRLTRSLTGELAHQRNFGPVDELVVDLAA
jgi:acetyltransferase